VAVALARAGGAAQIVLLVALILPLSVGVVVKAFAWTILLRSNGVVNQILMMSRLTDEPVRLLFTETGLVLGAVNIFLSFMVLPIYSVIRLIDPRLLDAAATLGSGPLHRFLHVTLPLTMPGVVAGVAFVFSMSASMYVIPTLLIGDRYQTLSTLIARSYLFMRDRSLGSTVAVVLLTIAVAVVVLSGLLARSPRAAAA
jgi:putative spermidine/putrescine transport system permease protein